MRKWSGIFSKRLLPVALSVALIVASVPGNEVNVQATTDKEVTQTQEVVYPGLPDEPVSKVEVFSPNGKMEKVEVNPDDFVDASDDSSDGSIQLYSDEVTQAALNFAFRDLVNNGSDSDNYCILIAGDGYKASEQNKFIQDAQKVADYFMTRVPFSESGIKNKINIRAVCVESNQSGSSMDPNNLYDTYFKSSFNNYGIERLVCIHDQGALDRVIQQYMPECNVPIVLVNSTVYGGSGGSVCVVSTNENSADIAFHEFGHTGGGLADEYWETTTDSQNRSEAPNRTSVSDPSRCKWSHLIGVNGVGLYQFDEAPGWYRPHQNCEMRYLYQEFCEVCKEQIRYKINSVINNKVGDNVVISNASQLQDYAKKVNAGAKTYGKKVTLANDINLTGSNNISVMTQFDGTFDGNGHKITGISINRGEGTTGFIGTLGSAGVVKNLYIENANVVANGYYNGILVGNNKGTIYQCSVGGSVQGSNGTGGIAGHNEGSIQDCYSTATVHSTSQVAGGIVGWLGSGRVNNCYNYGRVTSACNYWYGGIAGYNPGGQVTNNYYLSGTAGSGVAGAGDNGANAKSSAEFSNGTVTNLLNSVSSVWKQGESYPIFTYNSSSVEQPTTTKNNNTGNGPDEVFGHLISSTTPGIIDVVWGMDGKGQTYKVYVDGSIATATTGVKLDNVGCAAYQIAASAGTHTVRITAVLNGVESAGVSQSVTVTGSAVTTTTQSQPSDGYTTANANWTDLPYWSVYFASGWGGDPTGSYKDGGSLGNFALKINTGGAGEWSVQMRSVACATTAGKKYKATVTATANMASANQIRFKEENTQTEKLYTIASGTNTFEVEFTATDSAIFFFDLGTAPSGLDFKITNFKLEKEEDPTEAPTEPPTEAPTEPPTEEPTTITFDAYEIIEAEKFAGKTGSVIDTNSSASGGHNLGGVTNGVYLQYDNVVFTENAGGFYINYSSPAGTASGYVEVYLNSLDNLVGTVELTNNASTWQGYGVTSGELNTEIPTGKHTIYTKYVTTNSAYYVANIDYFKFVKATEYYKYIDGGIEINGYQVSTTAEGIRTVYSVDSVIGDKSVVSSGVIYSLADYADESQMYVGSNHEYVRSFESTAAGKFDVTFADSDFATSYAMTMKFATGEVSELKAKWRIRAYAKLSDGTYVYTECLEYSIYDVADALYQDGKMGTQAKHDYLYNKILTKVNKDYVRKDFDWNTTIVG